MSELPVRLRPPFVAVIGDSDPRGPEANRILEWAEEIGQQLARGGATLISGGLGGVMRASARGAVGSGGETIGILPTANASDANEYIRTPIATGLGVVRNLVVVTSADVVIAVGGRHGTLSEIGLALRMGRHVVALSSWRVESEHRLGGARVHRVRTPREAVELALRLAREGPLDPS
ncbi:MAG: TIGR00725 family protein [Candidatus Limnocylindria bacterium]